MKVPTQDIGVLAARRIVAPLEGETLKPATLLETKVIVGESLGTVSDVARPKRSGQK